jgi:hypothetical protein
MEKPIAKKEKLVKNLNYKNKKIKKKERNKKRKIVGKTSNW